MTSDKFRTTFRDERPKPIAPADTDARPGKEALATFPAISSLRTIQFRQTLRGYHIDDVDEYLERLVAKIEVLIADLEHRRHDEVWGYTQQRKASKPVIGISDTAGVSDESPTVGAIESLRTVKFRQTLRGYHIDDVDEYLERLAVEADTILDGGVDLPDLKASWAFVTHGPPAVPPSDNWNSELGTQAFGRVRTSNLPHDSQAPPPPPFDPELLVPSRRWRCWAIIYLPLSIVVFFAIGGSVQLIGGASDANQDHLNGLQNLAMGASALILFVIGPTLVIVGVVQLWRRPALKLGGDGVTVNNIREVVVPWPVVAYLRSDVTRRLIRRGEVPAVVLTTGERVPARFANLLRRRPVPERESWPHAGDPIPSDDGWPTSDISTVSLHERGSRWWFALAQGDVVIEGQLARGRLQPAQAQTAVLRYLCQLRLKQVGPWRGEALGEWRSNLVLDGDDCLRRVGGG